MNYCTNCAIRLYNNKHYNLQGIGNPFNGKCIVVPNVDYNAYKFGNMSFSNQVETIIQSLPSTGDVLSNLYIVPLIRCNETISCELDFDSYSKCIKYFAKDVKEFDFQDILLLGDAGRRFFNCNITSFLDTIIVSNNNRRYFVNYSPFIKYIDETKFNVFRDNLNKWYNAVFTKDYTNYKIRKL